MGHIINLDPKTVQQVLVSLLFKEFVLLNQFIFSGKLFRK